MKDIVTQDAPKRIKHVQFSTLSPQELVKISETEVTHNGLYNPTPDRAPQRNGVLDRRFGTSDKSGSCDTCGESMAECVGHYGYIKLALPVFHIGYFRDIIAILQDICKVRIYLLSICFILQ